MTKKDIVARMVKEGKVTVKEATAAVNLFITDIAESLSNGVGSQAKFIGVGTFKVYERKETTKKNPKTKEIIFVPAKNAIQYKAGGEIKDLVNTAENITKIEKSLATKAEIKATKQAVVAA